MKYIPKIGNYTLTIKDFVSTTYDYTFHLKTIFLPSYIYFIFATCFKLI